MAPALPLAKAKAKAKCLAPTGGEIAREHTHKCARYMCLSVRPPVRLCAPLIIIARNIISSPLSHYTAPERRLRPTRIGRLSTRAGLGGAKAPLLLRRLLCLLPATLRAPNPLSASIDGARQRSDAGTLEPEASDGRRSGTRATGSGLLHRARARYHLVRLGLRDNGATCLADPMLSTSRASLSPQPSSSLRPPPLPSGRPAGRRSVCRAAVDMRWTARERPARPAV